MSDLIVTWKSHFLNNPVTTASPPTPKRAARPMRFLPDLLAFSELVR